MLPLRDNAPKGAESVVTLSIIGVCTLVFIVQLCYPGGFEKSLEVWGEAPTRILSGGTIPGTQISAYWTWLSSMFMHGGLMHIIGNMVALWLFGDNVEWVMGRLRFALFYVGCGILANVVTTFLGFEGEMPGIGASGAIAGVMAAYMLIYPRARVTSLLWVSPFSFFHAATGSWGFVVRNISAFWYIGGWVLVQLLMSGIFVAGGVNENLGIYAHASGALFGAAMAYVLPLASRRPSADDPSVFGELTDPFFGEEGDGGGGRDSLGLDEEMRRIRLEHPGGRSAYQAMPVRDYHADELEARGEIDAALRHCQDMKQMALARGEYDRAEGYDARIALLEKELQPRQKRQDPGW
jgi:membrane associated rhomboid family serine protease